MVKKFKKGKPYTLCLLYPVGKRNFTTLCRNVTYRGKLGDVLEFESDGYTYVTDSEFGLVACDAKEGNEKQLIFHLTNIVEGWQF